MTQEFCNPANTSTYACAPSVPRAIARASRCELTDIKLSIRAGQIPADLQGHVFIVAPVGSVDSGGLPYANGDSFLNGDGMIYRFDCDRQGEVRVTTRLVTPPDYYADKATRSGTKYAQYQFRNHGIARFSLALGLRNQLNTAFLPMKFPQDAHERLLVTYDAGRSYEIDPETLEVVTPIGASLEWRGELDRLSFPIDALKFPFKSILSSAHPAFDAYAGKMFTVNYGRSLISFLQTIAWLYDLEAIPKEIERLLIAIAQFFQGSAIGNIMRMGLRFGREFFQESLKLIEKIFGNQLQDFTYLVSWDGAGNLERWKLVLPDRAPVRIKQTVHQLGVTKDYVVLMDTAFIAGIEQVLNNPFPDNKKLEQLLRDILERRSQPDSKIYIVRRTDLRRGQQPACSQQEVEVVAQEAVIPLEAAHFLVDYENPQGNITLHVGHICAMQVAEWIKKYDVSAFKPHNPVPSYLHGMEHDEVDIGRMGRYKIHGETGELIESQVISDATCTWAVDLYAYLDRLPTGLPPQKLENVYWSSFGLWKDLLTEYIFELYKDYKYQLLPRAEVLHLAEKGRPACLFRLDTKLMAIADRYEFPPGHLMLSPQFVPCGNGESSTDGYIMCAVCFEDNNEIWIFDAKDLAQGALCQLHHPSLQFGFTLHTTWLRQIAKRQASYKIPVRQDYQELVNQQTEQIVELFEQEIYPHFQ